MASDNNNNSQVTAGEPDPKNQFIKFSTNIEKEALAFDTTHQIMVLSSFSAPFMENKARDSRAPIDLVAVIDKSGSMSGQKLELVLGTMKFVVDQLKADDQLCIITYSSGVELDLPLTKMDDLGKKVAHAKIASIKADGWTNLSGGLLKGIQELIKRAKKNEVSSIMLFTDGLANEGITKSDHIVNAVEKTVAQIDTACTIFTFGYGTDHDEKMLRDIAESGKGMYYFIESLDDIAKCFGDCLGGLMSVVAQNISLSAVCADGAEVVKAIGHLKHADKVVGKKFEIPLGDMYSEESRDIIVLVKIPVLNSAYEARLPVMDVTLSYFNVLSSSFETTTSTVYVTRPATTPAQTSNPAIEKQRNRLLAAETLEKVRSQSDNDARATLSAAIDKMKLSSVSEDLNTTKLIADMKNCLSDLDNNKMSKAAFNKKMMSKAQGHARQRATGYDDDMYTNDSKQGYISSAQGYLSSPANISAPATASLPPTRPLQTRQTAPSQSNQINQITSNMNNVNISNSNSNNNNDDLDLFAPNPAVPVNISSSNSNNNNIDLFPVILAPNPTVTTTSTSNALVVTPAGGNFRKLIIGNTHSNIDWQPIPGTDQKASHLWKMYVTVAGVEDVSKYIEKVEYHIHPTFQPNKISVSQPPFELERKGWGFFMVKAYIHFQPDLKKDPLLLTHELCFEGDGKSQEISVEFSILPKSN